MTNVPRRLHKRLASLGVAAATGLGLLVSVAAPAAASDAPGFVVAGSSPRIAEADGHVFVASGDDGDDTVRVYGPTGSVLATIPNEARVESFDLNSDGSRLYVALNAGRVSVIDTSSLAEVGRYDVSNLGTPGHMVSVGNRLYVVGRANSASSVGVIDLSRTTGSAVDLFEQVAVGMAFAVRPTASQTTDEIYSSWCDFGGACGLDRRTYDGSQVDLVTSTGADDFGKIVWDAADGVVLTDVNGRVAVRYPDTLELRWVIAGELGTASSGLLGGGQYLVMRETDPATGRIDLVVRDLAGAETFRAAPTGSDTRLLPILQPDVGTTAYAAASSPDSPVRVVAFAHALTAPELPAPPTQVRAAAAAGGRVNVTWTASAQDRNNAPTRYEVSRSTSSNAYGPAIAVLAPSSTSYVDTSAGGGQAYYYRVAAINANGEAGAETDGTATPDATAPTVQVSAPPAFTLTSALTVAYHATDAGTGPADYDVRYRAAVWNGAFGAYVSPAAWQRRAGGSVSLAVAPGHEYCVSVRGRDRAGNVSAWSADRCSAAPLDDRSLRRATKGWASVAVRGAYRGTTTVSTTPKATLTLPAAPVERVALVATTCPTCGSLAIQLNGRAWRTLSLRSSAAHNGVVLALPAFSARSATVTIVVQGNRKVVVDGIGLRRT